MLKGFLEPEEKASICFDLCKVCGSMDIDTCNFCKEYIACIDCGGLYSPTTDYWMCVARIDDYGGNALYSDVG